MKVNKDGLKQRLMELGLLSNSKIELTKYRCGYTVKIRNATFAIDKDTLDAIMDVLT